jgi:hypothetical protein
MSRPPPSGRPSHSPFCADSNRSQNGILWAEIRAPKQGIVPEKHSPETKRGLREPGIWGLFARRREISVSARVRGGLGRTRTSNQAVMSAVTARESFSNSLRRTFADVCSRLVACARAPPRPCGSMIVEVAANQCVSGWPKPQACQVYLFLLSVLMASCHTTEVTTSEAAIVEAAKTSSTRNARRLRRLSRIPRLFRIRRIRSGSRRSWPRRIPRLLTMAGRVWWCWTSASMDTMIIIAGRRSAVPCR